MNRQLCHENVAFVGEFAVFLEILIASSEQLYQIVELSMDVAAYHRRTQHRLHIRLLDQDLLRLPLVRFRYHLAQVPQLLLRYALPPIQRLKPRLRAAHFNFKS